MKNRQGLRKKSLCCVYIHNHLTSAPEGHAGPQRTGHLQGPLHSAQASLQAPRSRDAPICTESCPLWYRLMSLWYILSFPGQRLLPKPNLTPNTGEPGPAAHAAHSPHHFLKLLYKTWHEVYTSAQTVMESKRTMSATESMCQTAKHSHPAVLWATEEPRWSLMHTLPWPWDFQVLSLFA